MKLDNVKRGEERKKPGDIEEKNRAVQKKYRRCKKGYIEEAVELALTSFDPLPIFSHLL